MKKTKKVVLIALSYILVVGLTIGGTIAWLTSTDEDVNVMVLGNVKIEQLEYERVVDEDGKWVSSGEVDKYGYTPDLIQEYSQGKPLMPAVFKDGEIKWDDRNGSQNASGDGSHQQSWGEIGAPGSNQLFDDSVRNVQDKFVFVKNTGKNNAYVRTWIALEQGSVAAEDFSDVIMTNTNANHWSWETVATDVVIDGNVYVVKCATYLGPKSNPTGILAPGATTYASLLQVYMKPEATNEDVDAIDGNGNGTYDILVFSQAVQTDGFDTAEEALDTAFGDATAENAPWDKVSVPKIVTGYRDDFTTDYNHRVAADEVVYYIDAELESDGGGVNVRGKAEFNSGSIVIDTTTTNPRHVFFVSGLDDANGHLVINDGDFTFNPKNLTRRGSYICAQGANATVIVNGGTFHKPSTRTAPIQALDGATVTIYGGTFQFDPSEFVAEGYVAVKDGSWWTVVAE